MVAKTDGKASPKTITVTVVCASVWTSKGYFTKGKTIKDLPMAEYTPVKGKYEV